MPELAVRRAQTTDIPAMVSLWYEKMLVQQQSDRRYSLLQDARAQWSAAARAWLEDNDCAVFVAEDEAEIVGYIVAGLTSSPPGLMPEQVGTIKEIAVGMHSARSGLGRLLFEPVRAWLMDRGITRLTVSVPRFLPVEQAFWRALGAADLADVLWIRL